MPSTSRLSGAFEHTGGGKKFGKEHQLALRRGRRTFVPAYVYTPAKCVHHLGLIGFLFELGKGSHWPAFVFTHWVSVPNLRKPAPGLDQTAIAGSELLFLG